MKIRNIYNQTTAPTIQDLWLYKGDLRYFGNKGWTSLSPDYTKNFEDIATQIDEINKQLDTIESTTADIGVLADKIGSNTYTDANYISKETNLTDAALQLDEEIKATNDNLAILNAASIKTTNVGSAGYHYGAIDPPSTNASGLAFFFYTRRLDTGASNVAQMTIPLATSTTNGLISYTTQKGLNTPYFYSMDVSYLANDVQLDFGRVNILNNTSSESTYNIQSATSSQAGVMSSADKTKLDSIINTGDGTKFLADDFTYKTIQMPDLSTYATKSELSGYLPLSGGTVGYIDVEGGVVVTTGDLDIQNGVIKLASPYDGMTGSPSAVELTGHRSGLNINSSKLYFYDKCAIQANSSANSDLIIGSVEDSLSVFPTVTFYTDNLTIWRDVDDEAQPIYHAGNFIAGTNYLAPGGVSIADVSGLQDSLDGKASLTGDSFKNNNACWGGTRPNGTQTCLLYIDTNGNNKLSNCYGGTYLRASAPHTLFLEVGTPGSMDDSVFYSIYNEGNFKAGTNYVAPSTLNNYLPLSGGTLTGLLNLDITSVTSTSYNEGIRISEAANGWSTLVLGTNGSSSGSTSTQFSIARNPANTLVIVSSSNTSLSETSTVTPAKGLGITQDNTDLTFNGNHVITKADTFNTITYTTSASEDNLRAWNNYINGYVTNLRISDSSYTEILMSTGVNQTSKVVYATQFSVAEGTSSFTLNVLSYTIADDGSVTKTMNSGTISSGGAN